MDGLWRWSVVGLAAALVVISVGGCSQGSGGQSSSNASGDGGAGPGEGEEFFEYFESTLVTEDHGTFRGIAVLKLSEPLENDGGQWHESSKWRVRWIRGGLHGEGEPLPRINVTAPAPASYDELDKSYVLKVVPRDQDPRVFYSTETGEVFNLWNACGETGEQAGVFEMEVDGDQLVGRIEAKLGLRTDGPRECDGESMEIKGDFEGRWLVDCWRAHEALNGGWVHDPKKKSDFCQQFKEDPWPN